MSGTDKQEMSCTVCLKTKDVPTTGSRALAACPECMRVTEFEL